VLARIAIAVSFRAAINGIVPRAAAGRLAGCRTAERSAVGGWPGGKTNAPSESRPERCQQFTDDFKVRYFCDRCHRSVFAIPHQLYAYCSGPCRKAFRQGRRRLLRRFLKLLRHERELPPPTPAAQSP